MNNQQNRQHEGTGLRERRQHLKALDANTFLLDEKTLAGHLRFLYDLSKRLNYYNLDGKAEKDLDWSHFLGRDISVQLARIATVSMAGIDFEGNKKNYERYRKARESKPLEACVGIIQLIIEYAREIHQWGLEVEKDIIGREIYNAVQHELSQQLFLLEALLDSGNADFANLKRLLSSDYDINFTGFVAALRQKLALWELDKNAQQRLLSSLPTTGQPFEDVSRIYLSFEKNISRISQDAGQKLIESLSSPDHLPHMGLLLAFFQLWKSHVQADYNRFTQRHLDFYYREVLNMKLHGEEADSLHVYFKASPDVKDFLLPAGSRLFAGKDAREQDIFYDTLSDTPVLPAEIASIKSILVEDAPPAGNGRLLARSIQGGGANGKTPSGGWAPFGDVLEDEEANIGVVIATPMLFLLEGKREVTLSLYFDPKSFEELGRLKSPPIVTESLPAIFDSLEEINKLKAAFLIHLSTAKGWLPVAKEALLPFEVGEDFVKIKFRLPPTAPPVVAFPADANPENYDNPYPQLRILLRTQVPLENGLSYGILKSLILRQIDVGVKVEGVKKLSLQNDFGPLDPSQAFQPFGTSPEKNSSFYIGSYEVFYKPLSKFSLHLEWAGLPAVQEGLGAYYKDYDTRWIKDKTLTSRPAFNEAFANDKYRLAISQLIGRDWNARPQDDVKYLFNTNPDTSPPTVQANARLAPKSRIDFVGLHPPVLPDDWHQKLADPLLLTPDSLDGFIKLQLTKEGEDNFNDLFGHLRYPLALADVVSFNSQQQAIASQKIAGTVAGTASGTVQGTLNTNALSGNVSGPVSGTTRVTILGVTTDISVSGTVSGTVRGPATSGTVSGDVSGPVTGEVTGDAAPGAEDEEAQTPADLPRPPYTPLLKSISLDYEAHLSLNHFPPGPADLPGALIHIHPFGTSSPESILSSDATLGSSHINAYLLPHFDYKGNLIIGIANLDPPAVLSLLFLIEEGSHTLDETPDRIQWSYLLGNEWVKFEEQEVLEDNTHRFTTSGTVVLQFPANTAGPNTILPDGQFWIQASVIPGDGQRGLAELGHFSKLRHIYTNGVRAVRSPDSPAFQGNLKAGTIEKLLPKRAEVNEVIQPDPSFGGRLAEKDAPFYLRVAESLRHKMRAITPWDFERIILEAFPEIFKVKCINHSRRQIQPDGTYELVSSPGSVLIVVIPQYKHRNDEAFVRPRASQKLLQTIAGHLRPFTSPLIDVQIINPVYEEIQVSLWLEMAAGKNTGGNLKELEASLQSLLSPWVLSGESEIEFDREIATSAVLGAIRQKDYVASINNYIFSIEVAGGVKKEVSNEAIIRPSMPWSVLVSSSRHTIFTLSTQQLQGTQALFGIPFLTIGDDFYVAPDEESKGSSGKRFQQQLDTAGNTSANQRPGPGLKPFIFFDKP
ncbi:MAG: hypothetical protein H6559_25310 [Lewinellaceae bacterium]|nr:hypothetical protein [Lewinellaceae bacterium]